MYDPVRYLEKLNPSSIVVEVFRTNVCSKQVAQRIIADLAQLIPNAKINFDLDDCDKILRIECHHLVVENVVEILNKRSFLCEVLE
ncbi:MAG: hypothetical protein ABI663_06430 [Chryseolinea sp.]